MRFLLMFSCAAALSARVLTPVWLELGPDGSTLARVVVDGPTECPELRADRQALPMHVRVPIPEGLKPVCEATVPAAARSLRWKKQHLRMAKTPSRVIAIGDTGCRVLYGDLQPCNDPNLWPFATVAQQLARRKPDLIIHVGDYLYRESPCPARVDGCAGPHGYNWDSWNADFFQPARAALGSAPWVFARGNHENCARAYRGWFYYLDPRPLQDSCQNYTDPYIARSGELRLAVFDSAATQDPPLMKPEQIPIYVKQLNAVSGRADWFVDHHPFWSYSFLQGSLSVSPATLGPAWEEAQPKGFNLVLSGHIHLFEFLELPSKGLRQLIAGDSGTQLLTSIPNGTNNEAAGALVKTGGLNMSFGLTELVRKDNGWALTLRNVRGESQIECQLPQGAETVCQVR